MSENADPYDAVLVLSFGGPERPDDVMPFLENVTRGRGVPPQRLAAVARHYLAFGGVSPLPEQCRRLVAAVGKDLAANGVALPVYWGNRNWHPFVADTVARMRDEGVRRAAVFATSAYSSYSSCRQYLDDIAAARAAVGEDAPVLDKLRAFHDHPGFVGPFVRGTVAALERLPDAVRGVARLVFVTHSIPLGMAAASGPEGGAYVAQHRETAGLVAAGVAEATGRDRGWDLVYCSRSGPAPVPWLEPDVNDHLRALHERTGDSGDGAAAVVVVPIGFVSDHMEVVHDLDVEAAGTAAALGLPFARAAAPGADPEFVAMVRGLVLERAAAERGESPVRACMGALGSGADTCRPGCCPRRATP